MTSFDPSYLEKLETSVPSWRADQMRSAYEVFARLEEPTGAEEDWRYVEYDLPFSSLRPVDEPGTRLDGGKFGSALEERSGGAVIVDGHVVEMSGEHVGPAFAELEHSSPVAPDHNKLAAAHAAFSSTGIRIGVPAGSATEEPIVVEIQGTIEDSASFPHLIVDVGTNAEASVLVIYRSSPGTRLLMIPEIDLKVADGGNLRFVSVQTVDSAATNVVHQRVHLGRDATSRIGEVGLGGDLGRLDLGVTLEGDGSSSDVVGLYFGEGDQTLDYRMLITHIGRSTTSNVFLKGAVEDHAESVFTGLLRIEKEAQKTSTFETNRNLVLSEHAKAHSVPNLEILCDDVVCGHASSVGPLEREHLYYLQSRGLRKERAERLLIRGFFTEVIDRLPILGITSPVSEEVFSRFTQAQEEGRVA